MVQRSLPRASQASARRRQTRLRSPRGLTLRASASRSTSPGDSRLQIRLEPRWFCGRDCPAAKSFRRVATTSTDSSGRYTFVRVADTNRSWYTSSRGLRSDTVSEQVHAKVSLASPDQYPVPGDRVSLMGRVVPSQAGDRVMLQRQEGSAWKIVASERLSARSRFSFRRRFPRSGRFTFRAVLRQTPATFCPTRCHSSSS